MTFFIKNKLTNLFTREKASILSVPAVDSIKLREDLANISRGTSSMIIDNSFRVVKKPSSPIPLPKVTSSEEIRNRLKQRQLSRLNQRKRRGQNQRDFNDYVAINNVPCAR